MGKATAAEKEAPKEETPFTLDDLYAGFTAEELAEFFGVTGQAANVRNSIPILKVNYCDIPDKAGNEIKKGNWVINQNSSEVEVEVVDEDGGKVIETRVEDIGVDLGKTIQVTVLTYGYRYSYFPKDKDKKKMCSSQLVFDRNKEKAVGSNYGFECGPKCPKRSKDGDQKDKCSCQWVIYVRVPMPDGSKLDAMLYAKGKSYMPFQDYVESAGTIPLFFAPTKLTAKMEREGSVTYFVLGFELLKEKPYPLLEVKENGAKAKEHRDGAELYKQQQIQNKASRQAQIADKNEGRSATLIKDEEIGDIAFD